MSSQTVTTASIRTWNLMRLNASSGKETPRLTTRTGRRREKAVANSATECAIPLWTWTTSTARSSKTFARRRALPRSNSCFKGNAMKSRPSSRARDGTSPAGRETIATRCPRPASPRASWNICTTLPVEKSPFSRICSTERDAGKVVGGTVVGGSRDAFGLLPITYHLPPITFLIAVRPFARGGVGDEDDLPVVVSSLRGARRP